MPSEHRLHPLSILFGLAAQVREFAVPLLLLLVGGGAAGWRLDWWVAGLIVPNMVVVITRVATYRYRYGTDDLVVRWGLLFRHERHLPYRRIQNLNASQSIVHRFFNVIAVSIETGSGAEPEVTMSVLPVTALEDMRRRVFAARTASMTTPDGVAAGQREAGTTLVALGPRDLAIVALAQNRAALVLAGLVGVVSETAWLESGLRQVFGPNAALDLLQWTQGQGVLSCLGLAVVFMLVWFVGSALLSMVWTFARFHDFRLVLTGSDLRADYGLFTRVSATLPRQRIQSATVRQGLVHRIARCVAVRARSAGGGVEESPGTNLDWIAPVLPCAQTTAFLNAVVPEAVMPPETWARVHKRAWLRLFRARLLWVGVAAAVLAFRLHWWALPAFVTAGVAAAILARMQTARMAWALTDRAIAFRSGLVRHQMDVVPLSKIQVVSIRQSPFDRRGGMATVSVDTAGTGLSGPGVRIPFLPADTARILAQRLGLAANDLMFRW